MAGETGLEPATSGFGDRRSTNWTTPLDGKNLCNFGRFILCIQITIINQIRINVRQLWQNILWSSSLRSCGNSVPIGHGPSQDAGQACCGAQRRNRTTDTRIFSPLLYRLSYLGINKKMAEKEGFEPSHPYWKDLLP